MNGSFIGIKFGHEMLMERLQKARNQKDAHRVR